MKDQETVQQFIASIPTPRLQSMAEQLRRRIDRECDAPLFSAPVAISRDDDTRQAVQDWRA